MRRLRRKRHADISPCYLDKMILIVIKSQLRLNSFFSRPADPAAGSSRSPCNERGDPLSSRRSSIVSIDGVESLQSSRASSTSPKDVQGSDYERNFPCFFLQSHTSLAPHNRFFGDEGVASACHKIDKGLEINSTSSTHSAAENPHFDFRELVHSSPHKRSRRPRRYLSVKDIVGRIHGTVDNPIDLSVSKTGTPTQRSVDMLKAVSTKYLRFAEDVRPPYIGTYTKIPPGQSMTRLCRNPFSRSLPSTNYDYDSEAEWEEPGEGEDLDSEGEEELGEDDDADDMEGFLDDDDAGDGLGAASNKRRHIMGDLEPVCTGLCWEGAQTGKIPVSEPRQATIDMRPFKLEVILGQWNLSQLEESRANVDRKNPTSHQPILDIILATSKRSQNHRPFAKTTARHLHESPTSSSTYHRPHQSHNTRSSALPKSPFQTIKSLLLTSKTTLAPKTYHPTRPNGRFQKSNPRQRSHQSRSRRDSQETVCSTPPVPFFFLLKLEEEEEQKGWDCRS